MRTKISKLLGKFRSDERGVTLVEYGVALVLAVAVGTTALGSLGGQVISNMSDATDKMAERPL